jgi:hypothetical protein
MTWDEITDANERIANPPMSDVVGSQRLGFYVVGRLARRLDATVELKPGRSQGTVVIIDLSPALFVPGSGRRGARRSGRAARVGRRAAGRRPRPGRRW